MSDLSLAQIGYLAKRGPGPRLGYAGTRARVEARAALEQAEELRRVLEELGERLGSEEPS
jgi:hypothetical protein